MPSACFTSAPDLNRGLAWPDQLLIYKEAWQRQYYVGWLRCPESGRFTAQRSSTCALLAQKR